MSNTEQQDSPALERIHARIDTAVGTLQELLDALTYDRKNNRPGILPRLDTIERSQAEHAASLKAHTDKESKQQLRTWLMEMGTYVLKVLLAAGAMYIAASAKKGIIQDFVQSGAVSVIQTIDGAEQCDGCQVAESHREPKLPRSPN